jgi:hypothetical protein
MLHYNKIEEDLCNLIMNVFINLKIKFTFKSLLIHRKKHKITIIVSFSKLY